MAPKKKRHPDVDRAIRDQIIKNKSERSKAASDYILKAGGQTPAAPAIPKKKEEEK
jgi:hypothetical protein